jgi:hypothetical protein
MEVLGAFTTCLGKFAEKGREHDLKGEGMNDPFFLAQP